MTHYEFQTMQLKLNSKAMRMLLLRVGGLNGVSKKNIYFASYSIYLTGMVDEESMPRSGVLMSPNYPERYPNNHDST